MIVTNSPFAFAGEARTADRAISHSVIAGKLFAAIERLCRHLNSVERTISPHDRQELLCCIGLLTDQADKIIFLESIDPRSRDETDVLRHLKDGALDMIKATSSVALNG